MGVSRGQACASVCRGPLTSSVLLEYLYARVSSLLGEERNSSKGHSASPRILSSLLHPWAEGFHFRVQLLF